MIGACLTTTATKWDANAARPIAVAFLPAKIGSGPNCRHAITVISPLTLPIRSQHALAENATLAWPEEWPPLWDLSCCVSKERRSGGQIYLERQKVCEGELTKGHIPQACRGARIYKIRQRGFPVLRSVSHKRQPPRNALRLSPRFTPRGNCFILFTLPPPRTTVSATKESFSWVTQ